MTMLAKICTCKSWADTSVSLRIGVNPRFEIHALSPFTNLPTMLSLVISGTL